MIGRVPIISSEVTCAEFSSGLRRLLDKDACEDFSFALKQNLGAKEVYLTGSGISSFYLILKMLQQNSHRREVIIPAYTAGSLVAAVKKAGLKPVLCDISLEDFNLDVSKIPAQITKDTLAVVCAHMFGIGMEGLLGIKNIIPEDVCIIEDCAQAMGTSIKGKEVGSFSDVSFFSFNRGKNMSLYSGGCIAANSDEFVVRLNEVFGLKGMDYKELVADTNLGDSLDILWKMCSFAVATNRLTYYMAYPLVRRFKDTAPPKNFKVGRMTAFQAAVGKHLLSRIESSFSIKNSNGMYLYNGLKQASGIKLAFVAPDAKPVFSRFPLLVEDLKRKERIIVQLGKAGVESSLMYNLPLHRMFDLGYGPEAFPCADYLAEHLITLPVHPKVYQEDLDRMIKIIRTEDSG